MSKIFLHFRRNLRDTRGVSLFIVFGLTLVLVLISGTVTKLVLGFIRTTTQVEQANIAYLAAESGIEMALYDLAAYKDGYQTDVSKSVCDSSIDLNATTKFGEFCDSSDQYRFVDFADDAADVTDNDLSGGRGFWRLFSRTLNNSEGHVIPNPYFVGDKDGELESDEWGELNKNRSISLSLLTDIYPDQDDPKTRFSWISDSANKKIIFDPGTDWNANLCLDADGNLFCDRNGSATDPKEPVFTWTLSALDGYGEEYTLQGVAWETDFIVQDCDNDGSTDPNEWCFIFDLNYDSVSVGPDGDVYAGEDINRNLTTANSISGGLNRVSAVDETFESATPKDYFEDLDDAIGDSIIVDERWASARLTINLIATLSETSGVLSNSLKYKLVSDEPWADEYTYIVSEGFAGGVKQAIETRFRRESVIPIFSYVIFQ